MYLFVCDSLWKGALYTLNKQLILAVNIAMYKPMLYINALTIIFICLVYTELTSHFHHYAIASPPFVFRGMPLTHKCLFGIHIYANNAAIKLWQQFIETLLWYMLGMERISARASLSQLPTTISIDPVSELSTSIYANEWPYVPATRMSQRKCLIWVMSLSCDGFVLWTYGINCWRILLIRRIGE